MIRTDDRSVTRSHRMTGWQEVALIRCTQRGAIANGMAESNDVGA